MNIILYSYLILFIMRIEQKATIFSISIAFLLTIIKLIIWLFSSSVAVLSSAIDSLLDLFVSLFNYFAIKNSNKKENEIFNYGIWKIEALASFIEGVIISLSWIYILYISIIKFINREKITEISISIIVMIISVIITWFLVKYLDKIYKETKNIVIKVDSLHYKTDLYTNLWILFSLVIIYFTELYFIDAIVWIIISVYIIYSSYKIIKEGVLLLLDISLPKKEVDKRRNIIKSFKKVNTYHCLRTRNSWNNNYVSVHLVFDKEIKLIKAHDICEEVENKIKDLDIKRRWIMDIHLDPEDDSYDCTINGMKN